MGCLSLDIFSCWSVKYIYNLFFKLFLFCMYRCRFCIMIIYFLDILRPYCSYILSHKLVLVRCSILWFCANSGSECTILWVCADSTNSVFCAHLQIYISTYPWNTVFFLSLVHAHKILYLLSISIPTRVSFLPNDTVFVEKAYSHNILHL